MLRRVAKFGVVENLLASSTLQPIPITNVNPRRATPTPPPPCMPSSSWSFPEGRVRKSVVGDASNGSGYLAISRGLDAAMVGLWAVVIFEVDAERKLWDVRLLATPRYVRVLTWQPGRRFFPTSPKPPSNTNWPLPRRRRRRREPYVEMMYLDVWRRYSRGGRVRHWMEVG